MRLFLILFLVVLFSSCGLSRRKTLIQVDPKEKEVVDAMFHGLHPRDSNDRVKRDRLIIDLLYSDWLGDRKEVKTGWQSIGWQIGLYRDFPLNKKSTIALGTGLRFGRSTIQHNGLFVVNDSHPHSVLLSTNLIDFKRHAQKFLQSDLSVPLELRFRGSALSSWKLTMGGAFGIVVNSYEKWRLDNQRFREYNHKNRSLFRGSAFVRLGYNKLSIYGSYHFIPVFSGAQDSKLNTFQIGLSFALF